MIFDVSFEEIYEDPFSIHDWDTEHGSRCFIHLVNSTTWQAVTGQNPPTEPPTAKQYTQAGYPWFDYYDAELKALEGSKTLAGLKSVKEKGEEKRTVPLRTPNRSLVPDYAKGRVKGKIKTVNDYSYRRHDKRAGGNGGIALLCHVGRAWPAALLR